MPNINFDQVERRDAKEPQITKAQLLEPPPHTASHTEWEAPRSIYGVGDLVANDTSWSFDALDTTQTPSTSSKAPVKQEPMTPAPGLAQHKRNYDPDDDNLESAASKKSRGFGGTMSRRESGTSSDDKYGHKTGVIDLTEEDSDDEQDMAMPERQFVPRAEHDSTASPFPRQKTSSPPRTFTKGLEPIAAHPRKPPIVHRQKPPIKPAGRQRMPISTSSPSPASAVPTISGQRRRLPSAQPNMFRLSDTPDRSSTAPSQEPDFVPKMTGTSSSAPQNPSGPFFEEEYSSEDEEKEAKAAKESSPRKSVTKLIRRPRHDPATRARQNDILEESRAMRAKAHERAQADLATRANTVAPRTDNADVDMIDKRAFLGLPHRRGKS
ncbi:hypothetical protein MBLNU13_g11401t2 [Cladosporium sp. NU13]